MSRNCCLVLWKRCSDIFIFTLSVPFKEPPKYNPNRRISGAPLSRTHSDPRLEASIGSSGTGGITTKPPSPSPSARSIPPFSSASSLSETSTGSGSTCTHPSEMDSEEYAASALGSASLNAGKREDVCMYLYSY